MYVRSRLAEHIKTHKFYEAFIEKSVDRDLDTFVDRINRSSTHGGHIELVACARSYGINIEVYQLKYPVILIEGGWVNECDECGECTKVSDPKTLPVIRLVYHSWGHYSCAIESNRKKNKHFPLKTPPNYNKSLDLSLNRAFKRPSPKGGALADSNPNNLPNTECRELWKLVTSSYKLKIDDTADKDTNSSESCPGVFKIAGDSTKSASISKERWEVKRLLFRAMKLYKLRDISEKDFSSKKKELTKECCEIKKIISGVVELGDLRNSDGSNTLMMELRKVLCQNRDPLALADISPSIPKTTDSSTRGLASPKLHLSCKSADVSAPHEMDVIIEKLSSINLSVGSE